jgi:hypothetical protein
LLCTLASNRNHASIEDVMSGQPGTAPFEATTDEVMSPCAVAPRGPNKGQGC